LKDLERREKEEKNLRIYGEKDPFHISESEEEVRKSMEKIVEEDEEEIESGQEEDEK
jgi:hypothetical protein